LEDPAEPLKRHRTPNKRIAALGALLNEAYDRHARPGFIEADPIHIPKAFADRRDAELIGFYTATIAWGQRKTIIANARELVRLMDEAPHDFVTNATEAELERLARFVHRTFNGTDLLHFIRASRHVLGTYGDLEQAFLEQGELGTMAEGIARFKRRFFEIPHPARTLKHVADPAKGSNAKRINMYLRWMVRQDKKGVDFGIWKTIKPAQLVCPCDLHVDRVARKLKLIKRKQTDWQTALELTDQLRRFDPKDPVKYDFALFGLGIEGWMK